MARSFSRATKPVIQEPLDADDMRLLHAACDSNWRGEITLEERASNGRHPDRERLFTLAMRTPKLVAFRSSGSGFHEGYGEMTNWIVFGITDEGRKTVDRPLKS